MQTYRELFRTPEFTPLFATSCAQVAATTIGSLALATLVYDATGSPLLSALSMFGASFAQVVGAMTLLSAADRLPPRATTAGLALVFAVGTAVIALPGLPIWAAFAVLLVLGLAASVGGGVRLGLLTEILPENGYLLGRSVLNICVGSLQIVGFAVGAVLVGALSARGTLLTAAALDVAAAAIALLGLRKRAPRAAGRPSVRETWRTNTLIWSSVPRRYVYVAMWVPNGLIVGCEAVFVAYDPDHAGLLLAAAAAGMLVGDITAGRFLGPDRRRRLGPFLRLLLAAPYLVFALRPALPLAVAAIAIASVGYAATLLLQERLIALTPKPVLGQALGLHSSGMLTMQAVGATIAGTVAQYTSPAAAMTVMAAASIAVTLAIAPGLRTPLPATPLPRTPPATKPSTPTEPPAVPEPRPARGAPPRP
ncbi:MFS transporter [Streptodolium elevatio]|uniref:MFS transporter n=1 Tax=Streptodolium elevatio TaxID=3157996 RepID=A0ABV3DQR6_9ACTN